MKIKLQPHDRKILQGLASFAGAVMIIGYSAWVAGGLQDLVSVLSNR